MVKELIKRIMPNNEEMNNKKKIENLVVFIIILIITLIVINMIWSEDKTKKNTNEDTSTKQLASYNQSQATYNLNDSSDELETKLQNILKTIKGVGNVNVFLNYAETSTVQAMYNENTKESETEEKDTSGGNRVIKEIDTQKEIVYTEDNGDKKPITQKVVMPKIEGAIITAEGAENTDIKASIVQAVEAVTRTCYS